MPDTNDVIVFTVVPLLIAGATSALIEQLKTNPIQVIFIFIITFVLFLAYSIYDLRKSRKKYAFSEDDDGIKPQSKAVVSKKNINEKALFETYDDLITAVSNSKSKRPRDLSERDEAKAYIQLMSTENGELDLNIEKLKEKGWWDYIKSQIFYENSHDFYRKPDVLIDLIKHGVWFSAYRYKFEPTLFLAIDNPGKLCQGLVSIILEKGGSIHDRNLRDDNILEKYIFTCAKHDFMKYSQSDAEAILDDITYLFEKGATFNFEKTKRVYDLAKILPSETKNKLLELFSKKNEELLELNTANAVATTRKSTRL